MITIIGTAISVHPFNDFGFKLAKTYIFIPVIISMRFEYRFGLIMLLEDLLWPMV